MSETLREKIKEILFMATRTNKYLTYDAVVDAILSIVREAVSAVKPNYKSYDDGEMSTAAKVADDYYEALIKLLS